MGQNLTISNPIIIFSVCKLYEKSKNKTEDEWKYESERKFNHIIWFQFIFLTSFTALMILYNKNWHLPKDTGQKIFMKDLIALYTVIHSICKISCLLNFILDEYIHKILHHYIIYLHSSALCTHSWLHTAPSEHLK